MNGGVAPITLTADLKRGGYSYHVGPVVPTVAASLQPVSTTPAAPVATN
jgi:hypothetical protein